MEECTEHTFNIKIAVDWTASKVVPVPNCLKCGTANPEYDHNNEANNFYVEHWDLKFKDIK